MSALRALQATSGLADLADLLGFSAKGLAYILYVKPLTQKYTSFKIPKKSGGIRQIDAPSADLKLAQTRLADLLQDCEDEIRETRGFHDEGPHPDKLSHGFRRNRSIGTNASRHRNRRYVFNLDLKDFFPACNFGRVRGIFVKNKHYSLDPQTAQVIAQIACHSGVLAQGAPSSPCISNIIAHVLDIHLAKLAANHRCVYSRYADDLSFSTNLKSFPQAIAERDMEDQHSWRVGPELERLIIKNGFTVNHDKTRMQYRDSRQEVTGLVVNKRVNVPREYRHQVRAMVHRLWKTGTYERPDLTLDESGNVVSSTRDGTIAELQGMLGYIDAIDRDYGGKSKGTPPAKVPKNLSAYGQFLIFSNFYAADAPVVITEGKTDVVYLTHAIRQLAADFPDLAQVDDAGAIKILIRLFKSTGKNTGSNMGLVGGAGDLQNFIHTYKAAVKKFEAPGMEQPVILLVDNDSASKSVIHAANNASTKKISGTEPFAHILGNLYLVFTPLPEGKSSSCIEDCLDADTLSKKVGDKSFSLKDDRDTDSTFGKAVFAYKVVEAQADKIDFSGFAPLLKRLTDVIKHNASRIGH